MVEPCERALSGLQALALCFVVQRPHLQALCKRPAIITMGIPLPVHAPCVLV